MIAPRMRLMAYVALDRAVEVELLDRVDEAEDPLYDTRSDCSMLGGRPTPATRPATYFTRGE